MARLSESAIELAGGPVVEVGGEVGARDACGRMHEASASCVVVTTDGVPRAICSAQAFARVFADAVGAGAGADELAVGEIASGPFVSAPTGLTLGGALELFCEHPDTDHLVLLGEDGRRLAVVSVGRAVRAIGLSGVRERERIDLDLQESHARFDLAVKASLDGLWDWDIRADVEYFSPRYKEILGYEDHELEATYEAWAERIHPDDRPGVMAVLEKHLAGEGPYEVMYRHRHRSGEYRWQRSVGKAVFDETGKPYRMTGFIRDITNERRQHELEVGLRRLLQQATEPAASLKTVLSEAVLLVEELADGMLSSILLLDEDRERLRVAAAPNLPAEYNRAIDGVRIGPAVGSCGTAAFRGERVVVTDIATDPLWADYKDLVLAHGLRACWSDPFRGPGGEVLGTLALYHREVRAPNAWELRLIEAVSGVVGTAVAHKRLVREVETSRARLREAERVAQIGSWQLDLRSGELWWSDEVYRIFEIALERFGASFDAFLERVHPEDRARVSEAFRGSVRDRAPYDITHRLALPSGRVRWVQERGETTYDGSGEPLRSIGTVLDVTDRVVAERTERDLLLQMEHMQRLESMGILAGGIAHDFNNILTVVLGNAELAKLELDPASDARGHVERISEVARRAALLCKQLLAYSGKGRFVLREVDLSRLVRESAQLVGVTVRHSATVQYHLAPGLPAVEADVGQLQQVVMNLVLNAGEALGAQPGVISIATGQLDADAAYLETTFGREELAAGRYVFLEVSDNGSGMSQAVQGHIFDPFYTTKEKGSGLGLSAVLGIVRGHGGGLRVYSEEGKGTTIKILLPASRRAPAASAGSGAHADEAWRASGTVLVVDDEPGIRQVARRTLERVGFTVVEAGDGEEALEVYREHRSDIVCVLLDVTMPRMDGVECFRRLRALDKAVRVLLSSGYNRQDTTQALVGKDLAGFLQKPYTPQQLVAALREVTARSGGV